MSSSKISSLSPATIPLVGSETLPVVQGGVTKNVSVSDLTAGRSVSASDYVISSGNIVPSTAGKGMNFTANAPLTGMTSQLLSFYEEGVFTPTFTGLTIGNGSVFGRYVRVGKQVTINYGFILGTTSSVAGLNGISGYPFTTANIGAGRFFNANGSAFKSGVGWYGAYAIIFSNSTTGTGPISSATDAGMSGVSPFLWGAVDSLSLFATYIVD